MELFVLSSLGTLSENLRTLYVFMLLLLDIFDKDHWNCKKRQSRNSDNFKSEGSVAENNFKGTSLIPMTYRGRTPADRP